MENIELFKQLYKAYLLCSKGKRKKPQTIKFEKNLEQNLLLLCDELINRSYKPSPYSVFIVNKPVKREIFAANFRDRVIHHFLIQRINPLFESVFITDSYACRKGKGTLFGVKRIFDHIYNCSHKYTKECYVLKLDISGFFMSISREILLAKVLNFVELNYFKKDKSLIKYLCTTIILTNPVDEVIKLGNSKNWDGLPKNKSLFYSETGHGLPIGNLTSQVFANFYMHYFDSFVKDELKIKYYGRYVDDFIICSNDKKILKRLIPKLKNKLLNDLKLELHPKKIYLQHYKKGVQFLGAYIKPGRVYIGNQTKGNFYSKNHKFTEIENTTSSTQNVILTVVNSYLGLMRHFNSYKIRKRQVLKLLKSSKSSFYSSNGFLKISKKRR